LETFQDFIRDPAAIGKLSLGLRTLRMLWNYILLQRLIGLRAQSDVSDVSISDDISSLSLEYDIETNYS